MTLTFDTQIWTWARFLYNAPNHQFNCSEVIVLTNKQTTWHINKQKTPLKTSTLLRYATPVGNDDNSNVYNYYHFMAIIQDNLH